MNPTPIQVRYHYRRVMRAWWKLHKALTAAHDAKVLIYDKDKFGEESPCATNYKTADRIEITTEKQLAKAMRDEIMKDEEY